MPSQNSELGEDDSPAISQVGEAIVIFDTDCPICSRWVRFVLANETEPTLRFASIHSPAGQAIAARHGLGPADLDKSYLVIAGDRALGRTDAGLALACLLRAPWNWLRLLRVVPRPLRDALYDAVGRHRYRLFGRAEQCFVPPPGTASRGLEI